jgi:hypothetical protein
MHFFMARDKKKVVFYGLRKKKFCHHCSTGKSDILAHTTPFTRLYNSFSKLPRSRYAHDGGCDKCAYIECIITARVIYSKVFKEKARKVP